MTYIPTIFKLQASDTPLINLHLYEHLFLRGLYQILGQNNFPYITLIGNISAQTFNNLVLLSVECNNNYATDIINTYISNTNKYIDLSEKAIKSELNRISAEDGYNRRIIDLESLESSLRNNNSFEKIKTCNSIEYVAPRISTKGNDIKSDFSPKSFRDITINLSVDAPSVEDRIISLAFSDLITELIDNALRKVDGYKQSNAELFDCNDDALLIKIDGSTSAAITDNHLATAIAEEIDNCIKLLSKDQLNDYAEQLQFSGHYFLKIYDELGVYISPSTNRTELNYKNTINLLKKISFYSINDWQVEDRYSEQDIDRPER